jgi:hypothetical protein
MALSDSCFNFLTDVAAAAGRLAEETHYSVPDHPVQYGPEIDALKRAANLYRDHPYDAATGARLLDLASAVGRYLNTPPGVVELPERSSKVAELAQELSGDLNIEDGQSLPSIIDNVVVDTPYTGKAAKRLKLLLGKVGGATYEIAVNILGDVATVAAKKMLGLRP